MIENEIPLSLINEFKKNNVVLFVGAGISINYGLPSWSSLLDSLGKRFLSQNNDRYKFYQSCNYQEKAQYLYDISDKITVINNINEIFSFSLDVNNNSIHEIITSLPINNIITTNWDNLIENAFDKKNIPTTKIWKDGQISSSNFGGKNIIKLHGTIEDPNSIIFSEEDYQDSFNNNPLLKNYLSTVLARSTILMIGYSYSDINFKTVHNFVNKSLGKNSKKIYILLLNSSDNRLHYLEKRGLLCINYNTTSPQLSISNFFDNLYDSVSDYADTSLERLKILKRENEEILNCHNTMVLRNMAALGPLGTPDKTQIKDLFGENTLLEIACAKNWRSILDKEGSKAKLILCLNEVKAKAVYSQEGYIERIESIIHFLKKYKEKIEVVDSGSPLIMSNFDIYGNVVFLENIKTNINNLGYSCLKVHREQIVIQRNINIFDAMFESIKELNLIDAKKLQHSHYDDTELIYNLIITRLNGILEEIKKSWSL